VLVDVFDIVRTAFLKRDGKYFWMAACGLAFD
jgi:hypothetical protein